MTDAAATLQEPQRSEEPARGETRCTCGLRHDDPNCAWHAQRNGAAPARESEATQPERFVSGSCAGETCSMCGAPAAAKVGEEIPHDDPNPHRHNLTAYVCADHFDAILRPHIARQQREAFLNEMNAGFARDRASEPPRAPTPPESVTREIEDLRDLIAQCCNTDDGDAMCHRCGVLLNAAISLHRLAPTPERTAPERET